jgi:hypothetical protein
LGLELGLKLGLECIALLVAFPQLFRWAACLTNAGLHPFSANDPLTIFAIHFASTGWWCIAAPLRSASTPEATTPYSSFWSLSVRALAFTLV